MADKLLDAYKAGKDLSDAIKRTYGDGATPKQIADFTDAFYRGKREATADKTATANPDSPTYKSAYDKALEAETKKLKEEHEERLKKWD